MKNIYYYIYYKQYKHLSKTNKSIPEWSSMILLSQLLGFNLATIIFGTGIYKNKYLFSNLPVILVGLGFILLFINYLIFIKNSRYLKIIDKFKCETRKQSIIGGLLVLIYVFVSL